MVPPKARFVAYYRVSTAKQGRSGLGLEAQQATVKEYLARVGGVALASFTEVESGKKNARPQLTAAILRCQQSNATLLVAKLDRLSRNAAFLMNLRDSNVKFEALDIQGANSMTVGVLALVAQHEAEAISARTIAALAARRARGLPLGTPRDLSAYAARASRLGRAVITAQARERAKLVAPAIEAAREQGCASLRQIAAYLNDQSITTPRGRSWTATAVRNAVAMIAEPARHK
ncbi:MAG: recombinase family protein [Steroidobacteraceae bacterium]